MIAEDLCWAVICGEAPLPTAAFIYGVTTTGICCRPGCPSRRPRRRNVRFFADLAQATAAGFRPCKRCHPGQSTDPQQSVVEQVCRLIERSLTAPTLRRLADAVGYSPAHLQRLFTRHVGISPHAYAQQCRLQRLQAAPAVHASARDAVAAAPAAAYGRRRVNTSRVLLLKGSPMSLHYALSPCRLGVVLVAASSAGICSIDLGDSRQQLLDRLQQRFPQAAPDRDGRLDEWLAQVVALIDDPRRSSDLPLDIQGTAFQRRVWAALQQIPPGMTSDYRAVATTIGAPTAARAVAAACAANTIAVVIPCHRVVRSDGSLSGYRWGVERKAALLAAERRQPDAAHSPSDCA